MTGEAQDRRVLPKDLLGCQRGSRFVLDGFRIGPQGATGVFGHPKLSAFIARCTDLSLRGNRIGDAGLQALSRSPIATALTDLDLTDCAITEAGLPFLDAFTALKRLSLAENPLGADGARTLAALDLAPRLDELTLDRTNLGADGLAQLRKRLTVAHLSVAHCGIDGTLGGTGGTLRPSGSLQLGGNPLGDAGASALVGWGAAPVQLSLHFTGLTDSGLDALHRGGLLGRVVYVDLRGNDLSAERIGQVTFRDGAVVKLPARIAYDRFHALRKAAPDVRYLFGGIDPEYVLACPYCREPVALTDALCPSCDGDTTLYAAYEEPEGYAPDRSATCPHCDARIASGASRCRACQSWLPKGEVR